MLESEAVAVVNPLIRNEDFPAKNAPKEEERAAKPASNPSGKSGPHAPSSESEPPLEESANAPSGPGTGGLGKKAFPLKVPPILFEADEPDTPARLKEEPKFALGARSSPPAKGAEQAVLPESYGTGRLWLVSRDPHCLYARWDLTDVQQRHYSTQAMHHHLALRIHLDSLPGTQVFEVQVASEARHVFIQVAFAGRWYIAELGYYQANQEWKGIAVSQRVATPPDSIAEDRTTRFAVFRPQPSGPPPPEPAAEFPPADKASTPALGPLPWAQPMGDFERIAPGAEPSMFIGVPFSEAYPEIEFGPGQIPVQEWTPAQEEALADVIDWSLEWREPVSSVELIQYRQAREAGPISSLELPMVAEGISSPAGGEFVRPKGFWFAVNAELVIYGATDPSARVTIGGRPIQLRPDGTFSYRFALPDGRYQMPIEATSVEGEVRRADMEFERGTRYQGEVRAQPQEPHLKTPEPGNVS